MKGQTKLKILIVMLAGAMLVGSCSKDEPTSCEDIEHTLEEAEVNDEVLYMQQTRVSKSDTPTLSNFEFLLHAVGSNCNQIQELRFYVSTPLEGPLTGSYDLENTIVFTIGKMTSATYAVKTLMPFDFDRQEFTSGSVNISLKDDATYEVKVIGELANGLDLSFEVDVEI